MTADNIKTCVLDIGEMMNVVLRSAWPKLEALAVSWWLNLMCANKGLAVWDFALSDVALYQQDERGVCPGCLLMWAQSLLHSQNLTWSDGPFFSFFWGGFFGYFFFPHTMPVLICPFGIKSVLFHPCVVCLFSFAVRLVFLFFFFGMGIW